MVRCRRSHLFFTCIIAWSSEVFRSTDGSGITWLEPPPSETITDDSNVTEANKSLVKGSLNAELNCNFSLSADLSIITVSMQFGGTPVANFAQSQKALSVRQAFKSRFNVTWVPNKLTLIFFQVTSADEGEFQCIVLTLGSPGANIQTWKRKIEVSLLVPSSISEVTGTTVIEGGNVILRCIVEGKPTPTIAWTRISDNKVVTMPLINFSRNNATEFKCTANNGIGAPATREVFVDVQYAVEPTGSGKNVTWSEGGKDFSFSCPVVGNPQPNITWYKEGDVDGTKISSGKQLTIITVVGDSGERLCYTCVASNSLGRTVRITQCLLIEHPTSPTNYKSTPVAISESDPWTIIGIVAGVGVLMAVVIGLVIWWVCKKRNNRTETKQSELQCLEVDHMDKGERLE